MSDANPRNKQLWYGYLEAGDKSTPVLADDSMDTGNTKTRYLFNLARKEFVEYRRDIVDGKLRELKKGEEKQVDELQRAFEAARPQFKPRVQSAAKSGGRSTGQTRAAAKESVTEDGGDEDTDFEDDDWSDGGSDDGDED